MVMLGRGLLHRTQPYIHLSSLYGPSKLHSILQNISHARRASSSSLPHCILLPHNHNSMSHPRVEEVTDSSGSDSDPDIIDIDTIVPAPRASQSNNNPTLTPANQIPVTSSRPNPGFDANTAKKWVCLYPVYFDASRSRQEGRRVGKELAVLNPLARTMADACANVGLRVFIDVGKTHPKDWANCGRVKVEMRDEEGRLKSPGVKNSAYLFTYWLFIWSAY